MIEQILTLQELNDRRTQIEREVNAMRNELTGLRIRQRAIQPLEPLNSESEIIWADQAAWQAEFERLFGALGIHGTPIGAEVLQQMMAEANLEPNE